MARNFNELKRFLEQQYPELRGNVTGENYPVPPTVILVGQLVSALQMFALALAFFGDSLWSYVPFMSGPPEWYYAAKENGMPIMIFMFLVLPTVVQKFATSGAFEVMLDGKVIFSKLEVGRMPSGNDIIEGMAKAGLKSSMG